MGKFDRLEYIIGEEKMKKLSESSVLICGVGGVGSFTAEATARCGVGAIGLVDYDVIDETNINRQIHAFEHSVGKYKTDEMKQRILLINSNCDVKSIKEKINQDNVFSIVDNYDYVVDAVDMVSAKLAIIKTCKDMGIPVISSMGAANKLYPEMFEISDIYKTSVCPLAKIMRRELKNIGIGALKVCYSRESPRKNPDNPSALGSAVFATAAAGLVIVGEVIREITEIF